METHANRKLTLPMCVQTTYVPSQVSSDILKACSVLSCSCVWLLQLLLRSRALQPLPFHLLAACSDDRERLLQAACSHLSLGATGPESLLRLSTALEAAALINPL